MKENNNKFSKFMKETKEVSVLFEEILQKTNPDEKIVKIETEGVWILREDAEKIWQICQKIMSCKNQADLAELKYEEFPFIVGLLSESKLNNFFEEFDRIR